jgi:mevalonate kinase
MLKVSAPGKLMLFGEHAVVYGRPCLVAAVDQRIIVRLKKREDEKICLNAPDVNIKNFLISLKDLKEPKPKEISFVLTAVKNFFEKYKIKSGLEIETKSEFSREVGLGSSSAVTVSTIKGLAELFGIKINKKELFCLAQKTVLDIQGVGSGFDVASAVYGKVLYFLTGGRIIEEIEVDKLPIIVGYTKIKADTPTLIRTVSNKLSQEPGKINKIFDEIEKIVNLAKIEIENQQWKRVGKLMNQNQEMLRELGVSSEKLENLIKASLKAGAFGAKLSGAGGGDCMIAIANEENFNRINEAIERAGGEIIKTKIPAPGVKIEK